MSEATNRVLEAQLRRQKQQKKRQKEWESALKPTTIDGSGVLRQLGQQPLDSRQILPNTASLNRPIRPTSVPGGVVADWLPRVKKEVPEVKKVKKFSVVRLYSGTSDSPFEVPGFLVTNLVLNVDGKFWVELGSVDLAEWRLAGEPQQTVLIGTPSFSSVAGTVTATTYSENLSGTQRVTALYQCRAAKGDYASNVESATGAVASGGSSIFVGTTEVFVGIRVGGGNESDSDSGSFMSTTSLPLVRSNYLVLDCDSDAGIEVTTTSSLSITDLYLVPALNNSVRSWVVTETAGWIAWYWVAERLWRVGDSLWPNLGGLEYLNQYYFGFFGKKDNLRESRVYVKRLYQNGNIEYLSGTNLNDLTLLEDDPLLDPDLADFFPNIRSFRLVWGRLDPSVPIEYNFCETTFAYTDDSSISPDGKIFDVEGTLEAGTIEITSFSGTPTLDDCILQELGTKTVTKRAYSGDLTLTHLDSAAFF